MGLFDVQHSRKPNNYPWAYDFIKSIDNSHWTVNEFSFASDLSDFKSSLNDNEREIVKKVLAAISTIELPVKTKWGFLCRDLPNPAITDLGFKFASNEVTHSEAYSRLLEVLGIDDIFEEIEKSTLFSGRAKYLRKHAERQYKDDKKQFIYSLALFTLFIENVSLFSQFYIIMWFGRYKNVLKDTNVQVTYTRQEESIHGLAGAKIINTLRQEYPEYFDKELQDRIEREARESIEHEDDLIDWMLDGYEGERISSTILKEYIRSRVNDSLKMIGYRPQFVINDVLARDFEWMEESVLGANVNDFFHTRSTSYVKKNKPFTSEDLF
jgi:ribonucleoside-diphosphate reductase beta chain